MSATRPRTCKIVLVLALAGAAVVVPATAVSAATINVGCSAADLIFALESANNETTNPGGDTIDLQPGCVYTFTERYGANDWATPVISGGLIINGNGAIVERGGGAPSMGFARVAGDLLVSNLTLREFWGFDGTYFRVTGSLVLVDSTITNAPPLGQQDAAIRAYSDADVGIINSLIENQVDMDSGSGGAIRNAGNLVVSDSIFRGNRVMNNAPGPGIQIGGAISNSGVAQIFSSDFIGNMAGATGAAISNRGDMKIYDSSFVGNRFANFGGAIDNGSDLIVERSYFEGNEANISGGAIYNATDALTQVVNSTFYRNRALAGDGGAILNRHGTRIEHSTFADNEARDQGDTLASEAGLISVEASILSHSASSQCEGTIADFGRNIIHSSLGTCPSSFLFANPRLVLPPTLLGGRTKTIALGAPSAAYNFVPAAGCPAVDQRGVSRPVGPTCDAGALEDQPPTIPGMPTLASGSVSPNTGAFGLTWSPATDPERVPLSYQLYRRDFDDAVFGFVATGSATSYSFGAVPESEGTYRYRVMATDGNQGTFSSLSPPIVVDRTPPTAPTASVDRPPDYVGDSAWYRDTVTVSFGSSTDPPLADTSPGSGVASTTPPQVTSTSGTHTVTGFATDEAGNASAVASLTVNIDAEPPVVGFTPCPSDVILGRPTTINWSASDASSGLASAPSGSIALDTSSIGTKSVVMSATDNVGHTASATCVYRVVFDFDGFFKPVNNVPALNEASAGGVVRLSFSLAGEQGMGVIADGYPQSATIDCELSPELTSGTPTTAQRPLLYNRAQGGRYSYLWSTESSWSGTCRQIVVKLIDGTFHRANVRLT